MSEIKNIQKPVDDEIKKFQIYFKNSMKSDVPLLSLITNYIIKRKGKQLRPLFVFLSAKMISRETQEATYTAAAMIELLHTASLIHDDVVDESFERRGFFSINALWKSKLAVLFGDFLLAKGLLISIENNQYQLLQLLSDAVKQMSEGEIYQIQKTRKLNITEEEYFDIITRKTASLFAACTSCGATSAKGTPGQIEKMKQFGMFAGIAFQIKDDLFDYLPKGKIGKPVANDIKEKKLTLPLIHTLNSLPKSERKEIIRTIRHDNKNLKKVQKIIDMVMQNGGYNYATQKMIEYHNKALEILKDFEDNTAKQSLIQLVDYLINRSK
ncbi:MAG: polyprenyl synthetase family protein [Bacteroidales bacterium]|nr:polyprenyl synthetase family protein [Bacteroidales bacterium]